MNNLDVDDDLVREIRMKYAEDIEAIIECPVCLEIPKGIICVCITGHHICMPCMTKLTNAGQQCPTCQCSFSSCRNYALENLCSKYEDIKSSILDPLHASNRRVIKDKISIGTQTNNNFFSSCTTKRKTRSCRTQAVVTEEKNSLSEPELSENIINGKKTCFSD